MAIGLTFVELFKWLFQNLLMNLSLFYLLIHTGWNIQTALEPDVHGAWGDWGELALCPNMTYAYAFALKVKISLAFCKGYILKNLPSRIPKLIF